jgi:hypothetical protein
MPSTTGRTKRAKIRKKARSLVRIPACVAVGQLLALVGRCDDPRLELFAAIVQRFHPPRHRVANGGRGIDGKEHCEGSDGAEHRCDPDDVDA